jgi:DNA-binding XRE family transcriptional regulator
MHDPIACEEMRPQRDPAGALGYGPPSSGAPTDRPGLAILASDILIHAALPRSAWRDSTMANGRRLPLIRIERKANGRLVPSIHGPYEGARGQLEAVAACLFDNLGRGVSYKWLLDVIGRKSDDFASRHLLRQYISALREMLLASKSPYFVAVVKERGYCLCEFAKSPRHSVSVGLDEGASEIGNKVRQLRIAAGLTQTALAKRADIDRTHLSRLERGRLMPTLLTLRRLAKTLRVTTRSLL